VRYRWRKPWHGAHTTLIVPEGWSAGFSHIDYPLDKQPSRERCSACDQEAFAYPHFVLNIKDGVPVRFITNAFGFALGKETEEENPYGSDVSILLGGIDKLKVMPSHILTFAPEHLVGLDQINLGVEKALFRLWQTAVLKMFRKNPINNRPVNFVNLGIEAGASLTHFHTQLLEVAKDAWGTIEKQIALVDAEGKLILRGGDNPHNLARGLSLLEGKVASRDLMAEVLKDIHEKKLVLNEDNNVTVFVEDAPMFPYETVIRAKRLGANSIIYLKPEERSSFAKAMDTIREAYAQIGVQDLNIVDESAQYDNRESCWRYGVRLYPRRIAGNVKRIGALDLKGIYQVPVSPEMAVEELLKTGLFK
jgi:galactose-1-phosphate uridylyltransferase